MSIGVGAALLGSAGIQAGTSILGSFLNNDKASRAKEERDYARQKEFAQNQIQWRAADAEKAGISKFAALGGSNSFFTPSYSNESSSQFGDTVSNIGNIAGSALSQYAMLQQQETVRGLELDNQKRELDILEKELELKKSEQNRLPSMTPPTQYYGGSQGVDKDRLDLVSETFGGIFGIPDAANAAIQSYSRNQPSMYKHVEAGLRRYRLPVEIMAYIEPREVRTLSNFGRPEIVFDPDWDKISKLKPEAQRRIVQYLDSQNHDYSLDRQNARGWGFGASKTSFFRAFSRGLDRANR